MALVRVVHTPTPPPHSPEQRVCPLDPQGVHRSVPALQGLWSIKVASGLAPCRSHGLRLDSIPSAFPARQVQLSCHTSPPALPRVLHTGWTGAGPCPWPMQTEFPSWRKRRRPALHPARLIPELRGLCQRAWLWNPSLLARDCLGTVALELVWGTEVLGFALPGQDGYACGSALRPAENWAGAIVNNTQAVLSPSC